MNTYSQSQFKARAATRGTHSSHRTSAGFEKLIAGGRSVESFYNRVAPTLSAYTGLNFPWYPGVVDRLTAPLTRFHE